MPSSKEQAEMEYMRERMAGVSVSDDKQDASGTVSGVNVDKVTPEKEDPKLDDSITAEAALAFKEEGNAKYKAGEYQEAIAKYSEGAKSAHAGDELRAVLLANRAAAQLKLQQFRETADDASAALKLKPGYKKALARRKEARIALKEFRGASEDAKELGDSTAEVSRLTRLAQEKETKDREEAMESLKGLGNSLLSNFGMSLDDFSMEKDPSTGNYSISMKK